MLRAPFTTSGMSASTARTSVNHVCASSRVSRATAKSSRVCTSLLYGAIRPQSLSEPFHRCNVNLFEFLLTGLVVDRPSMSEMITRPTTTTQRERFGSSETHPWGWVTGSQASLIMPLAHAQCFTGINQFLDENDCEPLTVRP
jgi:hypothetical protein